MSADDRWLDICALLSDLQENQIIYGVKLDLSNQVRIARFYVPQEKIEEFENSEDFDKLNRLSDGIAIDENGKAFCVTITVDVSQGLRAMLTATSKPEASHKSYEKMGLMQKFLRVRPLAFIASSWYNISRKGRYCLKGGAI